MFVYRQCVTGQDLKVCFEITERTRLKIKKSILLFMSERELHFRVRCPVKCRLIKMPDSTEWEIGWFVTGDLIEAVDLF